MANKQPRDRIPEIFWKAFVILGAVSGIALLAMLLVKYVIPNNLPKVYNHLVWILGVLFAVSGLAILLLTAFPGKKKASKEITLERKRLCESPLEIRSSIERTLLLDRYRPRPAEPLDEDNASLAIFTRNSSGKTEIVALLQEDSLTREAVDRAMEQAFRFIEEEDRIYTRTLFLIVAFVERENDFLKQFLCDFTNQGPNAGEYAIGIIRESQEAVSALREAGPFQKQFQYMAKMTQGLISEHCAQSSTQDLSS